MSGIAATKSIGKAILGQIPGGGFVSQKLHSLLTFSLVKTLSGGDLLAESMIPITERWLGEVEEISRGMKNQQVKQSEWQQKMDEIFARVDLADLLRAIDFDRLSKRIKFLDNREAVKAINLPKMTGATEKWAYTTSLRGLKRGQAVVPHCHRNLTSMHMPISGKLHARHYDRVADEPKHLIIQPTLDRILRLGEAATTSDDKDNVHWFKAMSDEVFAFNLRVISINPCLGFTGRQFYLDPDRGQKVKDDLIRVRQIGQKEAYKLYGQS